MVDILTCLPGLDISLLLVVMDEVVELPLVWLTAAAKGLLMGSALPHQSSVGRDNSGYSGNSA